MNWGSTGNQGGDPALTLSARCCGLPRAAYTDREWRLLSTGQRDRTDNGLLHRPCTAYYVGSVIGFNGYNEHYF